MKNRRWTALFAAAVILAGCASVTPGPKATAALASSDAQFQSLGLNPERVEPWEDGARTDGRAGTYEWWYFDFTLDDGATLVITYLSKDITRPTTGLAPFVTFALDRADGSNVSRTVTASAAEFSASRAACDVRVGASTARGDLHDYQLHVEAPGVRADIVLHGTVPPWRPGTGISRFGRDPGHFFAWLPSVPQGTVEGTLSIGGRTESVKGVGYHTTTGATLPCST